MLNPTTTIIEIRIGAEARRAHLARTGCDPGEVIGGDLSDAPAAVRAAAARYYAPEFRRITLTEASDTTPEAIHAALLAREARDDDAAARQGEADRHAEEAAEQEEARRKAAQKARADEHEAAKQAYLARWVATQSDEMLAQQYADGLLCRDDLVALVAADALAALPPEAEDARVCDLRTCPCGGTDNPCLPRAVYATWAALRPTVPAGTTWEFTRRRPCTREVDEEGEAYGPPSAGGLEYLVELHVPCGPFTFDRCVTLG